MASSTPWKTGAAILRFEKLFAYETMKTGSGCRCHVHVLRLKALCLCFNLCRPCSRHTLCGSSLFVCQDPQSINDFIVFHMVVSEPLVQVHPCHYRSCQACNTDFRLNCRHMSNAVYDNDSSSSSFPSSSSSCCYSFTVCITTRSAYHVSCQPAKFQPPTNNLFHGGSIHDSISLRL